MASTITAGNATNGLAMSSDGTGTLNIKTGTGTGTNAITIDASQNVTITGTLTASGGVSGTAAQIQPISASVAANALTISASALTLSFRSTTLGSGTVTTVSGTPSNLVVPASATLGTVSNVQSRLLVIALNNAGTIELAVVNISGGTNLDETNLLTTTAISSGSTSASVVYSTTARTSLAYRVIGCIDSTQTTAGTWATAPSLIQGAGGNALDSFQSLGYGQTWQSVTRTSSVTYYNTTGKPISTQASSTGNGQSIAIYVNGVLVSYGLNNGTFVGVYAVVPPGASYYYVYSASIQYPVELR